MSRRTKMNSLGDLLPDRIAGTLGVLSGREVGLEDLGEVGLEEAEEVLSDTYVEASVSTKMGRSVLAFPKELVAKIAGMVMGKEGEFSEEHLDALREVLGQAAGSVGNDSGDASFLEGVEVSVKPISELAGGLRGLRLRIGEEEGRFFISEDGVRVRPARFPSFEASEGEGKPRNLEAFMDLELTVSVELGRVRMRIKDIVKLGQGAIVELDKLAGEPVDLLVNGRKFAEGEVVVIDDNFGVRVTSLVSPRERLGTIS